jgi:hypothetical protein
MLLLKLVCREFARFDLNREDSASYTTILSICRWEMHDACIFCIVGSLFLVCYLGHETWNRRTVNNVGVGINYSRRSGAQCRAWVSFICPALFWHVNLFCHVCFLSSLRCFWRDSNGESEIEWTLLRNKYGKKVGEHILFSLLACSCHSFHYQRERGFRPTNTELDSWMAVAVTMFAPSPTPTSTRTNIILQFQFSYYCHSLLFPVCIYLNMHYTYIRCILWTRMRIIIRKRLLLAFNFKFLLRGGS